MPDPFAAAHVQGNSDPRFVAGGQIGHVRVAGQRAEIVPAPPAVVAAKDVVALPAHKLTAEGCEECAVLGIAGGEGQLAGEGFVDAGQPRKGVKPGMAAVGGADHIGLRRTVPRTFDGAEALPDCLVGQKVGREGDVVIRPDVGQHRPVDPAVYAADGVAEAADEEGAVGVVVGDDADVEAVEQVGEVEAVPCPVQPAVGRFAQSRAVAE